MRTILPGAARNGWQRHGIAAAAAFAVFCGTQALADQDFSGETVTAERFEATNGSEETVITGAGISTGDITAGGNITAGGSITATGSITANNASVNSVSAGAVSAANVQTGMLSGSGGSVTLMDRLHAMSDVTLSGGDLQLGAGSGMTVDIGDIDLGFGDLKLQHGNIDLASGRINMGASSLDETGLRIDGGPSLTRSGLDMQGRKMTQVGDGDVASGSQDAVNGGQLHATADSLATALGGGASVAADGTVTMPSYDFGGHSYAGVGAAFVAIDDAVSAMGSAAGSLATTQVVAGKDATASGANTAAMGDHAVASGDRSIALGSGAQARANDSVALGAGSVATRPNTVSMGAPGAERQIANVAPATQGTDAVNLDQLEAATTRMKKYSARAAAASMAQPSVPYLGAGQYWAGAALGTYDGEQALGLALSAQLDDRFSLGAGISRALAGSAPVAARVQVGVRW